MEDPITPSIITNAFTTSESIETGHISVNHLNWSGGNIEGNLVSSIVYLQHPVTQQFQESTLTFDSPFVEGPRFEILNGNQTWTLKADTNVLGNTLVARDPSGKIYGSEIYANVFHGNLSSASGSIDHLTTHEVHGNLSGTNAHIFANVSAPLFLGNVGLLDSYVETPTLFGNVEGNVIGEFVSVKTLVAKENLTMGTLTSDTGTFHEIQCKKITFDDATGHVTGNVHGSLFGEVVGNVIGNVMGNVEGDVTGNVTGNLHGNVYAANHNLHLGTNTFHEIYLETNGTKRMHITEVGGIGIGTDYAPDSLYALDVNGRIRATNEITAFSDRRLKRSIQPLVGSREKLHALQGVTFERMGDPSGYRSIGLIAQEVEKIVPEVVCTDRSKEGYKSIAYGNLVGLLIEAMKEMETCYEQKLQDLTASIDELKQMVSTCLKS